MAADVDVPEVTRLAGTIDRWRHEVMAYLTTGRSSSGPVEAVNGEIEQVDRAARDFRNVTDYAPAGCSRPPSSGRLQPHQDSAVAPFKTPGRPRVSSRRAQFHATSSVHLHGQLVAFIGPNEAGISSLLNAISLLNTDEPFRTAT